MSEKKENVKQFEFKAEIKQLLNILVHSLYTHKEIFLRELISNASDALDKLRFELTRNTDIEDKDSALEINISFDEKKKIISVADNGVGMTKSEVVENIGTIAKSGTSEFLEALNKEQKDVSNIIGKFGVGFYSVFMVAKEVEIKTKSFKNEPAVMWKSDGLGSYEIKILDEKIKRGTNIEIHLKDDAQEYLSKDRLISIVKAHSRFISFPIKVQDEQVNTQSAIWREPKSSLKKEQYDEFYKFLTYDDEAPLEVIHKSVDAPIQFNCLLFIPKKQIDLYFYQRENYGVDLYVKRVLIQHNNKDVLPEYLSFVKGVVDSEDLPLNISRETLQENIIFTKISSSVTTQILNSLIEMSEKESDKYKEFWNEHNKIFKLGYMDFSNKEKFSKLLRFNSSTCSDEKEIISLEDYIGKMKKGQKEIYYCFGNSRDAILTDPHLEIFKSKGLEVIYLFDPIDEFVISALGKYKDFEIKSVEQVDLSKLEKLESVKEDEKKTEDLSKEDKLHFSSLLSLMKDILGDKVKEVRESKRLKDSPACLVNPDNTISSSMLKMMQIMNKDTTIPPKILEINREHSLIRNLIEIYKKNPKDDYISDVTEQIYESLLLLEGYLTDPHKLVGRINKLLEKSSGWYREK